MKHENVDKVQDVIDVRVAALSLQQVDTPMAMAAARTEILNHMIEEKMVDQDLTVLSARIDQAMANRVAELHEPAAKMSAIDRRRAMMAMAVHDELMHDWLKEDMKDTVWKEMDDMKKLHEDKMKKEEKAAKEREEEAKKV